MAHMTVHYPAGTTFPVTIAPPGGAQGVGPKKFKAYWISTSVTAATGAAFVQHLIQDGGALVTLYRRMDGWDGSGGEKQTRKTIDVNFTSDGTVFEGGAANNGVSFTVSTSGCTHFATTVAYDFE